MCEEKQSKETAENCISQIEYNRKIIEHIEYEEMSYEFHNAREQYDRACDEYNEAVCAKEKAKKNSNDAKRYLDLLNAVELYGELKREKVRENAAREKLSQMEKGDDPDRYNDLVYSLCQGYSDQIQKLNNENEQFQQTYDEYDKNKAGLKTENDKIDDINYDLSSKIGKLENIIENFEEYEKRLLKELDVFPVRMLDGGLDKDSLKDICAGFADKGNKIKNDIAEYKKIIAEARAALSSLEEEKDDLSALRTEISVKLSEKEREKKEYTEAEKKALDALEFFGIAETELFNTEETALNIEMAERTRNEKLSEYELSFHRQERYLEAVKAGTIHVSSELSAELKKHNIDFTTGEEFLLNEPDARRTELLSKNPMLPFSYIVDERNLNLIKKTDFRGYTDKAVPIITYENIGFPSALSAKITEISKKSLLLCLYNERCIDSNSRETYIKELEKNVGSANKNIKRLKDEINELKNHKEAFFSFDYDRTFYVKLEQELSELYEKNEFIQKRTTEIPNELFAHNKTITEAEKNVHDLEGSAAKNIKDAERFGKYVDKYSSYLKEKQTLSDAKKTVAQNKARKEQIAEELNAEEKVLEETRENLRQIKSKLKGTEDKLSVLDDTIIGKRLPFPLEQIEQELRLVTDKVRSTRESLERDIKDAITHAEGFQRSLKKTGIPYEEYSDPSLVFSDELFDRAEKTVELCDRLLCECDEKLQKCLANKSNLGGAAGAKKETLKNKGYPEPLDPAQIKMGFDERKSELLEKSKALKKEGEKYNLLREDCKLKAAALNDQLVEELYSGKYIPADVSEVNTDELKKTLNDRLSKKTTLERALKDNYETVRQKYTAYNYEAINAFMGNMNFGDRNSFDGCFEVFDHIKECQKYLEEEFELIKNDLEQIENKKTNFIRHALEHAQKIHSEVKNISNLSKVKIDGKPRRMLVIGVPENVDSRCEENMREYLDKFLADIRTANSAEPLPRQKLLRKIENAFPIASCSIL